jgi:hypothetical protein
MLFPFPDLSFQVTKEAPFVPETPVFRGSVASNQVCMPDIVVGLSWPPDTVEPAIFVAVINRVYTVFGVSPEKVAVLLRRPRSLDGVAEEPFKL